MTLEAKQRGFLPEVSHRPHIPPHLCTFKSVPLPVKCDLLINEGHASFRLPITRPLGGAAAGRDAVFFFPCEQLWATVST